MMDMSIRTHASRPFPASDVKNIHNVRGAAASALNTFPFWSLKTSWRRGR
ncbi:hypothetical protein CGRA01v4_05229 [Colletotrichum graminicola]|nr:hypothetical protein CGRA01v4_05229 [Colletotrichum graminicola]